MSRRKDTTARKVRRPLPPTMRAETAIRRALLRTEQAITDQKEMSMMDAGTLTSIKRDLKSALALFKGVTSNKNAASFYATGDKLKAFYDQLEKNTDEETSLRLTEMAGSMINGTVEGGQLAREIYMAIGRAWEAQRVQYGYINLNHPTERWIVNMHAAFLNELERETRDGVRPRESHTEEAIPEETPEEMPGVIAPRIDEPVDLNLWRQVHPRTIKRCIVDVKGGAS